MNPDNDDVVIKRTPIVEKSTEPEVKVQEVEDPYRGLNRARKGLAKYLEGITAKARPTEVVPGMDPNLVKAIAIQDLLAAGDLNATTRDRFAEMMAVILGVPVDWRKGKGKANINRGVIMVPLRNDNGNNYELNVPVMAVDSSYPDVVALKPNGETGNTFRCDLTTVDGRALPRAKVASQAEVIAYCRDCDVQATCEELRIVLVE